MSQYDFCPGWWLLMIPAYTQVVTFCIVTFHTALAGRLALPTIAVCPATVSTVPIATVSGSSPSLPSLSLFRPGFPALLMVARSVAKNSRANAVLLEFPQFCKFEALLSLCDLVSANRGS